MPRSDHRIDRFTDPHGHAYCGVCHRQLFRRTFFAHPELGRSAAEPLAELDPEGPGRLIQIERHVGEPYRPEAWAALVANGLRHSPVYRPNAYPAEEISRRQALLWP